VIPAFLHPYCRTIGLLTFATSLIGCGGTSHSDYAQIINDLGGEVHVHVELGGTAITDSDLASLDFPDTVRSISLRDTAVTDVGATELTRGFNIERVDLTNTQITDDAMKDLKQMSRLWVVDVAAPNVSPQAFGKIRFFVSDRMLTIDQRSPIQPLPRLPVEGTEKYPGEEGLLPPSESLTGYAADVQSHDGELQIHLDFHDLDITDTDLRHIPLPESIRSISLRGTAISDEGVVELLRARNLERIDLRGTDIGDGTLEVLKRMPRLWEANVGSTKLSASGKRDLAKALTHKRANLAYDYSRGVGSVKTRPSALQSLR